MGLSNSVFLWGLILLLLPLLVHLFQFRRIQKIYFSNVNFLKNINTSRIPRNKLKQLFVLIARLIFLLFFILAFTKPTLRYFDGDANSEIDGIIIDNSLSLLNDCGTGDCIERAEEILSSYQSVNFLNAIKFNQQKHFSGSVSGREGAVNNIEIRPTTERLSISNELIEELESVVIISDFKPSSLTVVDRLLEDSIKVKLLPIEPNYISNVYVDTIYTKGGLNYFEDSIISIDLNNTGEEAVDDVLVKLFKGTQQLASSAVNILSNEVITLDFPLMEYGNGEYFIQIDDKRSSFDNEYFFSLQEPDSIKIALVGLKENDYLRKLYSGRNLFDFKYYSGGSIDYEWIRQADMVILEDLDRIPNWLSIDELQGDLLIIPSENIEIASLENLLSSRVSIAIDSNYNELDYRTLSNPFFAGIFENTEKRMTLPAVQTKYSISNANDILLANGNPYLVRFSSYENKNSIYLFTGSIAPLQNHSLFLPVMYRIAEQTQGINEPLSFELATMPIVIRGVENRSELYQLIGQGKTYIPEVFYNNSEIVLTLPTELVKPGHYVFLSGNDTVRTISLNIPNEASIVNFNSVEDLQKRYEGNSRATIIDTSSMTNLKASFSKGEDDGAIWKYALLLALMFLVAETAIHRWLK